MQYSSAPTHNRCNAYLDTLFILCLGFFFVSFYVIASKFSNVPYTELAKAFIFGQALAQIPILCSTNAATQVKVFCGVLAAALAASYVNFSDMFVLIAVMSALGFLFLKAGRHFFSFCPKDWAALPVVLCLVTLVVALVYSGRTLSPLFEERVLLGAFHKDTAFHIAISNSFRVFPFPSTGLDGVPQIAYHSGSHFLLARLGVLFNMPGVGAYNIIYPLVFVPAFFSALFILARRFKVFLGLKSAISPSDLLVLLFLLGALSSDLDDIVAAWISSVFLSESFLVSLCFAFLFCTLLLEMLAHRDSNITGRYLNLFFMILTGVAALFCKVSIAYSLCCIVGIIFLMFFKKMRIYEVITIFVWLALCLAFVKLTSDSDLATFSIFSFLRKYVQGNFVLHIVLHHMSLFILCLILLYKNRTLEYLYKNKTDFNILFLAAASTVLSLVPTIFFKMYSSEYYFSVPRILLIAVCMAYSSYVFTPWFKNISVRAYTAIFCVLLVFPLNTASVYASRSSKHISRTYRSLKAAPNNERRRVIEHLESLFFLPVESKRSSLVYIPPAVAGFWGERDWPNGLLIPALSGHAALDAAGPGTKDMVAYGMNAYPQRDNWRQEGLSDQELLTRASDKGFRRVLIVTEQGIRKLEDE